MGRHCRVGQLLAEDWGLFYARAPVLLCLQRTAHLAKSPSPDRWDVKRADKGVLS